MTQYKYDIRLEAWFSIIVNVIILHTHLYNI